MNLKIRTPVLSAIVLALLSAAPLQAQDKANDAKCLLVSNLYAKGADDEKARSTALRASFFYLGRMTGTAAEVQARVAAEAKKLTPAEHPDTMAACANAMVARAEELGGQPASAGTPAQGR